MQEKASQMTSMPYRAPELYQVPAREHITTKTDVWSLGCVLYAMAFGYSPTECSFTSSGSVRIIECSSLSVLGPIKFPPKNIYSTQFYEFTRHMLTHDPSLRPTIDQIITRLHHWESSH
uniref:non-specific serine/threonine protein kinase n=1 Tax=Albugo laibachii Nc14 TaxID=890382 RepID=F0WEB6_9STRA|nr:serine/threonine protein kinase putative [Albugo laibachii Nc14]|eukprot:CCA19547.1 serine/threonine protein kinase putative [Albugo laibachii Nc14]